MVTKLTGNGRRDGEAEGAGHRARRFRRDLRALSGESAASRFWNGDFATMEKIKQMFDPERLLNRGRLYGRI